MYFEDFQSNSTVQSAERIVTEADVMAFAQLTGDFVALHTDEEFAKTTPYGQRIAHGALVFSLSIGLATQMQLFGVELLAFAGVDKLRFVAPVFFGDRIHVVKRVTETRALGDKQGTVTFESRVVNQHGKLVLVYYDKLLVKRKEKRDN